MTRREWLAGFAFVPQFWNERRSSQWTPEETAKLLSDSPWVRKSGDVTVLWVSAAPVQMALARQEQGTLSVPSAPRRFKSYVIRVLGVPPGILPKDGPERRELMLRETKLIMRGSPDILPDEAKVTADGLEYWFPSDHPITVDTKRLDFSMRIGKLGVRVQFQPSQMLFGGELAV